MFTRSKFLQIHFSHFVQIRFFIQCNTQKNLKKWLQISCFMVRETFKQRELCALWNRRIQISSYPQLARNWVSGFGNNASKLDFVGVKILFSSFCLRSERNFQSRALICMSSLKKHPRKMPTASPWVHFFFSNYRLQLGILTYLGLKSSQPVLIKSFHTTWSSIASLISLVLSSPVNCISLDSVNVWSSRSTSIWVTMLGSQSTTFEAVSSLWRGQLILILSHGVIL